LQQSYDDVEYNFYDEEEEGGAALADSGYGQGKVIDGRPYLTHHAYAPEEFEKRCTCVWILVFGNAWFVYG
jgi:hypothetical protein